MRMSTYKGISFVDENVVPVVGVMNVSAGGRLHVVIHLSYGRQYRGGIGGFLRIR